MKHTLVTDGPNHFECTVCTRTWPYRPYSNCPGIVLTPHTLFKNSDHKLECHACGQIWRNRPTSYCPGMRVYSKHGHTALMTRFQLGYMGYRIAPAHLPQPVGCYRSSGTYILLYDPAQATKKQTAIRHRVTTTHSDIFWPRSCLSMLDSYLHLKRIQNDWYVVQAQSNLADIAYYFSRFTGDEIGQFGNGYMHLSIVPCILSTTFMAFQASSSQRAVLVKSVLAAYEKQQAE